VADTPEPSTVEPMIVVTVLVLLLTFVACFEIDRVQAWLAEWVDWAALRWGLV
jgi:hypothetical protein